MRDDFWDVLAENGVQAFFCGHTHHLSVARQDGVYQINSGEATSDHLNVGLIDVYSDHVEVRLYETNGSIPEVGDNPFFSNLNPGDTGDEAFTVFFYSDMTEPNEQWWTCFVETLMKVNNHEKIGN